MKNISIQTIILLSIVNLSLTQGVNTCTPGKCSVCVKSESGSGNEYCNYCFNSRLIIKTLGEDQICEGDSTLIENCVQTGYDYGSEVCVQCKPGYVITYTLNTDTNKVESQCEQSALCNLGKIPYGYSGDPTCAMCKNGQEMFQKANQYCKSGKTLAECTTENKANYFGCQDGTPIDNCDWVRIGSNGMECFKCLTGFKPDSSTKGCKAITASTNNLCWEHTEETSNTCGKCAFFDGVFAVGSSDVNQEKPFVCEVYQTIGDSVISGEDPVSGEDPESSNDTPIIKSGNILSYSICIFGCLGFLFIAGDD